MNEQDKQLVLKDICARLPYGVKVQHQRLDYLDEIQTIEHITREYGIIETESVVGFVDDFKPYLRPISSMTEEEAKEIAILHDIKDILSVKVTSNYIDVIVDDGVCSTETRTIWYDEIITSIEIFDWLNKHHFDYRSLIQKGLALEAPNGMYN